MNQMTRTASPTPQAAIPKPTVAPPAAATAAPLVAAGQTTAPIIPGLAMGSPIRQPPSSATGSPVARAAEVLSLSDIFVPIESVQPGEHLVCLDKFFFQDERPTTLPHKFDNISNSKEAIFFGYLLIDR